MTQTHYNDDLISPKMTLIPQQNGSYSIKESTVPGYVAGSLITEATVKELQTKKILCLITESSQANGKQLLFG